MTSRTMWDLNGTYKGVGLETKVVARSFNIKTWLSGKVTECACLLNRLNIPLLKWPVSTDVSPISRLLCTLSVLYFVMLVRGCHWNVGYSAAMEGSGLCAGTTKPVLVGEVAFKCPFISQYRWRICVITKSKFSSVNLTVYGLFFIR